MSYRPPTTSKYAPVSDPVPPSPFEQKRSMGSAVRTVDRQSVDWKAFGGTKKEVSAALAATPVKTFTPIQPRNQLATYIDLAAPSISKEEEKWQQSAIRRRPVPTPSTIPVNKSYEDLFPTLGGARTTPRPTSPAVKPSPPAAAAATPSGAAPLSMAERMRLKLAEEEQERQRQQEQSERERLAREEEERQGRVFGFVRSVNLSKKRQIFEDDEEPLEDGETLETDAYGFRMGDSDSYLPSEEEPAEDEEGAW